MSSTPRRAPRPLRASLGALALAGIVGALAAGGVAEAQADPGPPPGARLSASAQRQIDAIVADKQRWTPAERKVAPDLLYARNEAAGKRAVAGAPALKSGVDVVGGTVLVDLDATVTQNLLDAIDAAGGTVTTSVAAFDAVRAEVPVDAVVDLAERNDVAHVRPADEATTNQDPGAVASSVGAGANEAEVTHGADDARIDFGVDGTGQKVCVLSDGVDSLADRVASGDLPNDVDVLAGQAGSGDEGTAMLELIHDIAPGADLGFATAFNSLASFAQNIIDLRADGCTVIVDDITYFVESNMQDGPIAQAVTTVRNDGAIYFSSSSNSGNLPDGTSGTWQGDF
ncbi:MAG: hypothetical protein KDA98_02750, partial [Acidimicrobiales bacterium]|nr:hypothetical protein [Acidimicrobiales bacterium]